MLQHELQRLVEAELLYQRGLPPQATYIFKHALIQDTAYASLLRSTRQEYHRHIAEILEDQFPETAETQPELLAHHYTEAGLNEQAIGYWQHAGDRAIQRSAHVEAIGHLKKGLEMLASLPATPARCQHELAMQVPLGRALLLVQGFAAPEVERVFSRARVLCQHLGDTPQLIPVLNGLWNFHVVSNEFQMAYELAEQLCSFEKYHSIHLLGYTLFYLGKLTSACAYLETSIAFHDAQRAHLQNFSDSTTGVSTGIGARSYASWVLWLLGYPDQAYQRRCEALSQAHERSLPVHVATHLYSSAGLHQFCQDSHAVQEQVEPLITLASEQQFAFLLTSAKIWQGWALTMQGQSEEGIAQLRQGLTGYQATGAVQKRPYFLAMLAEAYKKAEQIEEGLIVLAEALAFAEKTEECWYEAELHRLRGELLLQQSADNATEAESCFQQAISIAQNQSAKSWELRAATSLARLWQSQGKRAEARALLAPVYGWFTEGFDTADLQEAKALLDELR
jgi:predicted ATPase